MVPAIGAAVVLALFAAFFRPQVKAVRKGSEEVQRGFR
jgi:hypothetical protein